MQIFSGGKLIGGADDLVSLESNSKLSDALAYHEGDAGLPQPLMTAVMAAPSEQQVLLSPCTRTPLARLFCMDNVCGITAASQQADSKAHQRGLSEL